MKLKRKCSIEGCNRKYSAKGFCYMHYQRKRYGRIDMRPEKILPNWGWNKRPRRGKCSIEKCDKPHWQHGFCRMHWARVKRTGTVELPIKPKIIKCQVEDCQNKDPYILGYCHHHYSRFKRGLSLTATRKELFGGKNNPRWAGGTSEYPNHSLMKKIRLEVLKEANYTCHFCGGLADRIHHLDKSKSNHSKDNLVASCCKCNAKFRKSSTSKYKRLYGHTAKELIEMKLFKNIYQIPDDPQLANVIGRIEIGL